MRGWSRAVAAATFLAVPVAAAPAPAAPDHPTRAAARDTRHDVRRVVWHRIGLGGTTRTRHRLPTRRAGDITAVRVLHAATAVRVRVHLARVGSVRGDDETPQLILVVPAVRIRVAATLHPGGTSDVGVLTADTSAFIACPAPEIGLHRARRTIEVTVPRSCLGDPSWVRVRARVVQHRVRRGQRLSYTDDVAPSPDLITRHHLTPRAYRPPGAVVRDVVPPFEFRATARPTTAPGLAPARAGRLG